MEATTGRSLLVVAFLQAATALTALLSSPTAALAATAIGALAVGRYAAVAYFAASMGPSSRAGVRAFAASAWVIGLAALLVAVAAVAVRARPALPWAVAAALVGPLGMSALALGAGIGSLASAHTGGKK
jgi:hypothetical protein